MTSLQRLIRAARHANAAARRAIAPPQRRAEVPSSVEVATIRARLRMTQAGFAGAFGLPVGTVRDWEQGRCLPDAASRAYLVVIARDPETVRAALLAGANRPGSVP